MNDNDTRRYEMFLRVRQLGTDESASIASFAYVKDLFNSLGEVIAELEAHANQQASGLSSARQSTQSLAAARDELESDLKAISRTARSIANSITGLEQKFRWPSELTDNDLLTRARMFAADALPLKAEFIKRGLPANFLDDLNEDIAAFEQALTQRNQSKGTHVNATATIDDLIERGMKIVRELDSLMRNLFENAPGKLAAWLSASHIERAPRSRPATPTQPQAT